MDMNTASHTDIAKQAIVSYVSLHPNSYTAAMGLGELYMGSNDYYSASTVYRKIIETHPKDAPALNNLAFALLNLHKPKEALIYAKKAVQEGGIFLGEYKQTLSQIQQRLKEVP